MHQLVYPMYIQKEAINSLLNSLTESVTDSRKEGQTSGKDTKIQQEANIKASFLDFAGGGYAVTKENGIDTGYSEERLFTLGTEHKAKQVREILRKQGSLFDLNDCIKKHRPCGHFVDFRGLASFLRLSSFILVKGFVEHINFATICSPDMFTSRSHLFQLLHSNKQVGIAGFGIITGFEEEKNILEIKSFLLAFDGEAYHF